MTEQELKNYLKVGKLPAVVFCEKRYEGICCMLKVTRGNKVFLDYDDTYDDASSEGAFRATFLFDSFDMMIRSIEDFTKSKLNGLTLNPYCYDKFICTEPQWEDFKWDLYNGKIQMLDDYTDFFIGSYWWNGLFLKKIKPDCSTEELNSWIRQANKS